MAASEERSTVLTDEQRAFLAAHTWAILATGRSDGSPQQSMIGYHLDDADRLVISAKSYTAKWRNALRQPQVCLAVPDGRACLVLYGRAEAISADPERAELTADVFAALSGAERGAALTRRMLSLVRGEDEASLGTLAESDVGTTVEAALAFLQANVLRDVPVLNRVPGDLPRVL